MAKKVADMDLEELDRLIADLEDEKEDLRERTRTAVDRRKALLAEAHLKQKLGNLKLSEDELVKMGVSKEKAKAMAAKPKEQVATPLPVTIGTTVQKTKATK